MCLFTEYTHHNLRNKELHPKMIELSFIEKMDLNTLLSVLDDIHNKMYSEAKSNLLEIINNSPSPKQYQNEYEDENNRYIKFWNEGEFLHYVNWKPTELTKRIIFLPNIYPQSYYYLAYISTIEKNHKKTIYYCNKGLALQPKHPFLINEKANAYKSINDFDTALKLCQSINSVDRYISDKYYALSLRTRGSIHIDMNNLDTAEKFFKQSLIYDPNSLVAINEIKYIEHLRTKNKKISPNFIQDKNSMDCDMCKNNKNNYKVFDRNSDSDLLILCNECEEEFLTLEKEKYQETFLTLPLNIQSASNYIRSLSFIKKLEYLYEIEPVIQNLILNFIDDVIIEENQELHEFFKEEERRNKLLSVIIQSYYTFKNYYTKDNIKMNFNLETLSDSYHLSLFDDDCKVFHYDLLKSIFKFTETINDLEFANYVLDNGLIQNKKIEEIILSSVYLGFQLNVYEIILHTETFFHLPNPPKEYNEFYLFLGDVISVDCYDDRAKLLEVAASYHFKFSKNECLIRTSKIILDNINNIKKTSAELNIQSIEDILSDYKKNLNIDSVINETDKYFNDEKYYEVIRRLGVALMFKKNNSFVLRNLGLAASYSFCFDLSIELLKKVNIYDSNCGIESKIDLMTIYFIKNDIEPAHKLQKKLLNKYSDIISDENRFTLLWRLSVTYNIKGNFKKSLETVNNLINSRFLIKEKLVNLLIIKLNCEIRLKLIDNVFKTVNRIKNIESNDFDILFQVWHNLIDVPTDDFMFFGDKLYKHDDLTFEGQTELIIVTFLNKLFSLENLLVSIENYDNYYNIINEFFYDRLFNVSFKEYNLDDMTSDLVKYFNITLNKIYDKIMVNDEDIFYSFEIAFNRVVSNFISWPADDKCSCGDHLLDNTFCDCGFSFNDNNTSFSKEFFHQSPAKVFTCPICSMTFIGFSCDTCNKKYSWLL